MGDRELYGNFTTDGREFVITNPETPRPWFNYLWNDRYAALISHTGGGFSFAESPRDNRLTRMRYNSLPWDRPGRYVLVKDRETGVYHSLSWAPTLDRPYPRYECAHGQGYTRITTECQGLRGVLTYFVPRGETAEVWRVSLTNTEALPRTLEIYAFVELLMGNALNDLINQPNDKHFPEVKFDDQHLCLVASRRYWVLNRGVTVKQPNVDWPYRLYFTHSLPLTGFDGSLEAFIGRWRSEANPIAVTTGRMGNTEITAGDPIAALQSVVTLAPQETQEFAVVLALAPKTADVPAFLQDRDHLVAWSDRQFQELTTYWDRYLSALVVQTPDPEVNRSLSIWNPYQAAVTFEMARNSGYYHGGLLFGTGLRDRFQDILGVLIAEPERVRPRLRDALRYQFADGSTLHNFFRLTGSGEKTNHSDTPLWIPFGVMAYLKETADFEFLQEIVPFYDGGESTVGDRLRRALDYSLSQLGPNGLPRIHKGDWNDTLDYIGPEGRGETVWGAGFLAYILRETFPLWEWLQDEHTLQRYQTAYTQLQQAVNERCWDGEWYLRAFRDDGSAVGSRRDRQGQLFLNAQSWAILAGIAPPARAQQAIAACRERLLTPYGMQIVAPAYREVEPHTGLISRCVPGKKENGAVFNHASSWFVLAALTAGETELAWEVYRRMLPANSAQDRDRYEVEPYVFAEYVTSPEHPTQGQASHSWLTGTAVWMLRIGVDGFLGLQPELGGLRLSPRLPAAWPEVQVQRRFRGKTLRVQIRGSGPVSEFRVNGERVAGNLLRTNDFADEVLTVEVDP